MGDGRAGILVLCEGDGDRAFVRHLAEARGIAGIEVDQPPRDEPAGKNTFGHRLKALAVKSGIEAAYRRLLIMADSDDDPAGRFAELRRAMEDGGFVPPACPREPKDQNGLPPVEVLMVPVDGTTGNLESLCYEAAVHRRPELGPCIETFAEYAKAQDWPAAKVAKLRLRCLIAAACQADPNRSLQYCWKPDRPPRDLIPLEDAAFDSIAEHFRRVTAECLRPIT